MNSKKEDPLIISNGRLDSAELSDIDTERQKQSDREVPNRQSAASGGKNYLRTVLVIVMLPAAVCCWLLWMHSRAWERTDDAQIDGHIYPVSARVGGRVARVLVEDGQFVHEGEVLLQIDPADFQLAVHHAAADYKDAEATAEAARLGVSITRVGSETQIAGAFADIYNTEAGVSSAQEAEKAAFGQLAEAKANARKLNSDVERYRPLLEKNEITQQQFDQAITGAEAANAAVVARQAGVAVAHEQVRQAEARHAQSKSNFANAQETSRQILVSKARSEAAQAQVLQAKAGLEQAKLNLQYTTVAAPAEGIVGKRSVQVGQNIQPNEDLLAIVPLKEIWVTANFKETQLERMRPGQPVQIKVDTYGGRRWRGHVSAIGGATGARYSLLPPENATGNYVKVVQRIPVRIDFDDVSDSAFNTDGLLRPGMSVVPDVKVN
ncbi:MAG TPA: HlyD family secretion protein [Candidatus Eremiobacteraceae bacterium]|nr:HlyD family secretion protein [Candidatus Eremiobacteraceae bacterium]